MYDAVHIAAFRDSLNTTHALPAGWIWCFHKAVGWYAQHGDGSTVAIERILRLGPITQDELSRLVHESKERLLRASRLAASPDAPKVTQGDMRAATTAADQVLREHGFCLYVAPCECNGVRAWDHKTYRIGPVK